MSALPDHSESIAGPGNLWIDRSTGSPIPRRNRRRNLRVRMRLPITVYLNNEAGTLTQGGTLRDMSIRGMNFCSRLELALGDRATVDVEFEYWTFRVSLVVRFAKPIVAGTQVGCEFCDLSIADGERIAAELERVKASRSSAGTMSQRIRPV